MTQAAISFQSVSKHYKDKKAVDDLSFEVEEGTVISLLGPNGAGKTTAISMMLGLRRPTSGSVRLQGHDPTVAKHRVHIGAMLQQVELPPNLSVTELLNLFRSYYPKPLPLERLVEIAGLAEFQRDTAVKLSGGQKRRLQFALAMAGSPSVLFLDEPTTAMDVTSRRLFWEQLRRFAKEERRTVVLTTHHIEEADQISDRILVLQNGRQVADGTPAELKQMTGDRYVSFVAGRGVDAAALDDLPGVRSAEWSGRHVRLRTTDSDAVLRALILRDLDIRDIEVGSGALEDAFVALTEEDPVEAM